MLDAAREAKSFAAGRISEPARQALPAMPWRQVTTMRNRLIHAYFDIDLDIVWNTVQGDLPPLIEALEQVLPAAES